MKLFLFLLAGILLGPTVLHVQFLPEIKYLFSASSYLFLFVAGLELDFPKDRRLIPKSSVIALGAFIVPLVCSFLFLSQFAHDFGIFELFSAQSAVFAIAISVSAVPVIIQLLREFGYYNTETGHLVLSAAILCDLMAWMAFAWLLAGKQRTDWLTTHITIMLFFVGVLFSAFKIFSTHCIRILEKSSAYIFAPLFFVSIGLKIDLLNDFDITNILKIMLLATLTKMAGSYMAARSVHLPPRQAWDVASLLNARGAMEVMLASLALQMGLIGPSLFTCLVAMAFGTTLIVGPLLKLFPRS